MSPQHRDKRRFQPVKVEAIGYESGRSRFYKDEQFAPPALLSWRNNLTALSQHFDLYFVAVVDTIHVYVPQFCKQTLGNKASLILAPPPAKPDAKGYLDQSRPHGINHLIVGDLGRDEVLILSTDSGNVAAYHTSAIARAVERNVENPVQTTADDGGIRPFFTHWVFESAWGLAVHQAARLIAVSANVPRHVRSEESTGKITVFAFALTSASSDDGNEESSTEETDSVDSASEEWMEIEDHETLQQALRVRDRNLKIILSKHTANIPNVAFLNNYYDRDGKFLIATDIEGQMKVWKVWDREVLRSYDLSDNAYSANSGPIIRERDVGWSVIPLDPASFRTTSSLGEFCGQTHPSEYYPSSSGSYLCAPRESYLLTVSARRWPIQGSFDFNDEGDDEELLLEDDSSEDQDEEVGGVSLVEADSDHDESVPLDSSRSDSQEVLEEGISPQVADETLDRVTQAERLSRPLASMDLQTLLSADRSQYPGSRPIQRGDGSSTMTMTEAATGQSDDDFSEPNEDSLRSPNQLPLFPSTSQFDTTSSGSGTRSRARLSETKIPPMPVLHLSQSNIRLINAPFSSMPHFILTEPCAQEFPPAIGWMHHMDRLNMSAYLPDIGLVIAASQTGRVVLLTLTRRAETGCLGFRLDHILPFEEQERAGQRPSLPLLGMAVSPIQGSASPTNELDQRFMKDDLEKEWGADHTVNGIFRSFDPNLLDLDAVTAPSLDSSDGSSDDDSHPMHYQRAVSTPQYRSKPSTSPRKTLSPPSRRHNSTNLRRQQPTLPSRKQLLSTRSSPKKQRTISAAATMTMNSPVPPSSPLSPGPQKSHHQRRKLPLVTTPWTHTSNTINSIGSSSNADDPKRYRLLLTYYDHTVLSYEIERCQGRIGLWGSGKHNWNNREDPLVV